MQNDKTADYDTFLLTILHVGVRNVVGTMSDFFEVKLLELLLLNYNYYFCASLRSKEIKNRFIQVDLIA
jgi:hypothetical protein